uniref:hypothetical protein n=1 Tax=Herbidospora sakaeratensis TaxID=564415 RepID=UPI0012F8A2D0|nr:hypothetical protein [Herbidospora sakaeratensis]
MPDVFVSSASAAVFPSAGIHAEQAVSSDLARDDSEQPVVCSDEVAMPPRGWAAMPPASADQDGRWLFCLSDVTRSGLGAGQGGRLMVMGGVLAGLRPSLSALQVLRR